MLLRETIGGMGKCRLPPEEHHYWHVRVLIQSPSRTGCARVTLTWGALILLNNNWAGI